MKRTQIQQIVDFCRTFEWITQRDAYKLGIYRLASRINDMNRIGYFIKVEYVTVTNIDGTTSRIARYKIITLPDGTPFKKGEPEYAENVSV